MPKVFISYGSKSRQVADGLCAHLEERGIPCWMAPRDISSGTYAGEITRAIKAADVMVAIFSKSSHSEHVKNEVNVAFNNCKLILPYCLDDTPFDDDLEYWLSAKQRIVSSGDIPVDYQRIERIIREFRGEVVEEESHVSEQQEKPKKRSLLLRLICVVVLLLGALFYFLRQGRPSGKDTPVPSTDTVTVTVLVEQEVAPASKPVVKTQSVDPDANTFTGTITDGYPDGFGIYTFKKPRRIDMHYEGEAEAGDYIKGSWKKGHLNYGEWYGADGKLKEFIQLGEHLDVEKDQQLGKCVKP